MNGCVIYTAPVLLAGLVLAAGEPSFGIGLLAITALFALFDYPGTPSY